LTEKRLDFILSWQAQLATRRYGNGTRQVGSGP
jgi:hypothetical protein